MTRFDEYDKIAADAVQDLLGSPVVWRPSKRAGHSRDRVNRSYDRDPDRPLRELVAIVTWKPNNIPAGATDPEAGLNRGSATGYDCVVDVESEAFVDTQTGAVSMPKEGDLFWLKEEIYQGNEFMEVDRIGDDGSARTLFFCQTPTQRSSAEDFEE